MMAQRPLILGGAKDSDVGLGWNWSPQRVERPGPGHSCKNVPILETSVLMSVPFTQEMFFLSYYSAHITNIYPTVLLYLSCSNAKSYTREIFKTKKNPLSHLWSLLAWIIFDLDSSVNIQSTVAN